MIIDNAVRVGRIIGSPRYRVPEEQARAEAAEGYDRNYYPQGVARHFSAVLGSGSLRRYNRRTTAPTVVIHGRADKLMRPFGAARWPAPSTAPDWCYSTGWVMICHSSCGIR